MNTSIPLRMYIAKHHVRQKDLADHLGVSRQTISSWTRENAPILMPQKYNDKVAEFFGISVSEFFSVNEVRKL